MVLGDKMHDERIRYASNLSLNLLNMLARNKPENPIQEKEFDKFVRSTVPGFRVDANNTIESNAKVYTPDLDVEIFYSIDNIKKVLTGRPLKGGFIEADIPVEMKIEWIK